MLIFYQYPVCSTCKKAKADLLRLGVEFEDINIKTNPPSVETLRQWVTSSDFALKSYFNTSGNSYRSLGLKDKFDQLSMDEALILLANDGMLIKRPILVQDGKVLQIGYRTGYEDLNL